jgi:hypothetical protein
MGQRDAAHNTEELCNAAPSVASFRYPPSPFASYENFALVGRDLQQIKGVSIEQCRQACAGNQQCIGYDFDKWNGWCFTKGEMRGLRLEPKSSSGVLFNMIEPVRLRDRVVVERYRGKHFPGKGYMSSRATSFEQCESSCQGDPHCVAYTYHKADNRCEAFASAGEYFTKAGADSGVKRQLPPK